MRRATSAKKVTMYVQTTLKKRKVESCPLKRGAGPGSNDMKEEDIIDEIELATSSTLS